MVLRRFSSLFCAVKDGGTMGGTEDGEEVGGVLWEKAIFMKDGLDCRSREFEKQKGEI